jgi:hypothetical protein
MLMSLSGINQPAVAISLENIPSCKISRNAASSANRKPLTLAALSFHVCGFQAPEVIQES